LRGGGEGAGLALLHDLRNRIEHVLLLNGTVQLPASEHGETRCHQQAEQHERQAIVHDKAPPAADNAGNETSCGAAMQKLLIIAFLIVILWNLGAGLYYMMVDKGTTDRTVRSLSWRIGISVVLILIVMLGIYTGWIKPHGVMH
jgi:hypothetical protein